MGQNDPGRVAELVLIPHPLLIWFGFSRCTSCRAFTFPFPLVLRTCSFYVIFYSSGGILLDVVTSAE